MQPDRSDVLLVGYEDQENLGLRSIAAFLKKNGIRVKIEPYDGTSKEKILKSININQPKIVGFSLIFQRMLFDFADLISFLRKNGVLVHFTMGGHFPTLEYEGTLRTIPELDSVIRHEGEFTFSELFHFLDQPAAWANIKGLAYRDNGEIVANSARPLIDDLDILPYPLRASQFRSLRGKGVYSILASRGCYYSCSFCSIHQFYSEPDGAKRRTRSPANVVGEMEQLFYEHGARIFIFKDDDLSTKGCRQSKWIGDFAAELRKKGIADEILWRISCRVDEIDEELMKELKEVGLGYLYLGIESGNDQGLKTCAKRYAVSDIIAAVELLDKLGIPFEYGFMLFDPDSTISSIRENIAFLKYLCGKGRVVLHYTKMFPYVGTAIAQKLKKEGRLSGTIAAPDYPYRDPKVSLLQTFLSRTFRNWNFNPDGLCNRLQLAQFDAAVIAKFFSDKYDAEAYAHSLKDVIRKANDSALETMSIAANFIAARGEAEVIDNWQFLEDLSCEQTTAERLSLAALNRLVRIYGWDCGKYDTLH